MKNDQKEEFQTEFQDDWEQIFSLGERDRLTAMGIYNKVLTRKIERERGSYGTDEDQMESY